MNLLSVVLALALTAALAACGSDEPSGVTGPDRTASTPRETPASPARTPTTPGSGDAPTATDAPEPATATAPPAASGSAETDREALVALYNATDGENWPLNEKWLSDAPLGEWYGVTTNDDGRVAALDLRSNALSGEIPAELGSLSNLRVLVLSGNDLSGELPAELGSLSNLTHLYLSGNALSGCVPSSLEDQLVSDYSKLGDLPYCYYTSGSAETDREALVALYNATGGENAARTWYSSNNWLSDAPLGEWYGVTTNDDGRVTALSLNSNELSGEIPAELGSLSNLVWLDLSFNELSGEIPAELGSLSNLTKLYLENNELSGEIPAELGSLSNLRVLVLSGNDLSGELPAELGSLSNLTHLYLSGNALSGCVPSSLEDQLVSDYSKLGDLPYCYYTSGSAETDREALVALYNATGGENAARTWYSSNNWLSDAPLGEWYGVTTNDDGRVTALSLNSNELSGEIPPELGSLSNLVWLDLSFNELSGEIPAELGSLSNLTKLILGSNELSGEIPAELGSLSNLSALYLGSNELSGEIPAELGSLSNLTELYLSANELSGEIPAELGSLSNLSALYLTRNELSGCVPSSLENQLGFDFFSFGDLSFC